MEQQIKERKKKLTIDLWIIALVTIAVYIVYGVFGSRIMSFCKNSDISVWPRLLTAAALEFGIAGLGITIVGLMRKESFASFGLRWENAIKAVLWTIVFFLPYILFIFLSGQFEGYEPLSIMVTPDLHKAGIVATIIGTLVIAVVWGFFVAPSTNPRQSRTRTSSVFPSRFSIAFHRKVCFNKKSYTAIRRSEKVGAGCSKLRS